MLLARRRFLTMLRTISFSNTTKSLDLTTHLANFTAKSLRWRETFKCFLPSLLIAFLRLVVLSNTAIIHPVSNTTVSDKTSSANHFINDCKLFCRTSELGFKYEQDQYPSILWDYFTIRCAIARLFVGEGRIKVGGNLRPLYAQSGHSPDRVECQPSFDIDIKGKKI